MKISFIVPSWHYFNDPFKLQPYWELYYATILRSQLGNKAEIDIIDLRGKSKDNDNFNQVTEKINERDFYLYWIMKSGDANEIYSILKLLKEKFPKSKHIAGGTHVDMLSDECEKIFDSIIVGPGENNFLKAVNERKKKYAESYNTVEFSDTPFPDRNFLPHDSVKVKICLNNTEIIMLRWCISPEVFL